MNAEQASKLNRVRTDIYDYEVQVHEMNSKIKSYHEKITEVTRVNDQKENILRNKDEYIEQLRKKLELKKGQTPKPSDEEIIGRAATHEEQDIKVF